MFDHMPPDRRDVGLESEPAGGCFDLLVVAADGGELGSDFDLVGAVDVGALQGAELVAVAGDAL